MRGAASLSTSRRTSRYSKVSAIDKQSVAAELDRIERRRQLRQEASSAAPAVAARGARRFLLRALGRLAAIALVGLAALHYRPQLEPQDTALTATLSGWERTGGIRDRVVSLSLHGGRYLAVTAAGVVLESADGGAQWAAVRRLPPETGRCSSLRIAAPGRPVAVCTRAIVSFDSVRQQWARSWTPPSGALLACDFDGPRGYAVGEDATALASRDGGLEWVAVELDILARLESVVILDGGRAVAVGSIGAGRGVIFVSDGFGAPFHATRLPQMPLRVVARSGDTVVVAGAGGTASASTDGGRTWKEFPAGAAAGDIDLLSVTASAERFVAVAGSPEGVFFAANGGGWQPSPLPAAAGRATAFACDGNRLIVCTESGDVYRAEIGPRAIR